MKKILLTGANGFIGNYFKNNYQNKYDISIFSFTNNDIEKLNLFGKEIIIHLSALVHQMNGASEEEYEKINVAQTINLAQKAKESGIKHFIFMSTIAVYGVEIGMLSENTQCCPITDYGKSKYKAECELLQLENESFKISIIRPPIVNGFEAPGNMKSLIHLVKKVVILPFGKINNRRSMVYIGNLCHLVDTIIQKKESGIFLAADNKPLSTTKLIELIAKELDKKVYLLNIPLFPWLLKKLKPSFYKRLYESLEVDNTKTKKILNLKNPYSVEDGIGYMIRGE